MKLLLLREKYPKTEFSGPYFPVFSPNTGKHGPEKTPHLDTFHTVLLLEISYRQKSHQVSRKREKLQSGAMYRVSTSQKTASDCSSQPLTHEDKKPNP